MYKSNFLYIYLKSKDFNKYKNVLTFFKYFYSPLLCNCHFSWMLQDMLPIKVKEETSSVEELEDSQEAGEMKATRNRAQQQRD